MNKFFLLAMALATSACVAQTTPPPVQPVAPVTTTTQSEVLTRCVYKYDSTYNVEFLERNKVVYHPANFPELTVYHITDTNGKRWSINQFEWTDYTCTSVNIPKG